MHLSQNPHIHKQREGSTMLKRNYLGALSLFAAGAMLLCACIETATPTAAPVHAAGPTQTPTPCACSASLPTVAMPTAAASTAPASSAAGAAGQVTIVFPLVAMRDHGSYRASQ